MSSLRITTLEQCLGLVGLKVNFVERIQGLGSSNFSFGWRTLLKNTDIVQGLEFKFGLGGRTQDSKNTKFRIFEVRGFQHYYVVLPTGTTYQAPGICPLEKIGQRATGHLPV